jgi:hypothetical protein
VAGPDLDVGRQTEQLAGGLIKRFGAAAGEVAACYAEVGVEDGVAAEDVVCLVVSVRSVLQNRGEAVRGAHLRSGTRRGRACGPGDGRLLPRDLQYERSRRRRVAYRKRFAVHWPAHFTFLRTSSGPE